MAFGTNNIAIRLKINKSQFLDLGQKKILKNINIDVRIRIWINSII